MAKRNLIESFEIALVKNQSQLKDALRIREEVFVKEQKIPKNLEVDGKDNNAIHALVTYQEMGIATGRLTISENQRGHISRIAVLPAYRGHGLGGLVVKRLEEVAHAKRSEMVFLYPHQYLENFYINLGYLKVPNSDFEMGTHTLIKMTKWL